MIDTVTPVEILVEGKRLGRFVHHDPKSKAYPFLVEEGAALVSKRWSKDSDPILDQGQVGSCTGNASVGALICSNDNPLHTCLSLEQDNTLNETLALKDYTLATETDPIPGSYPSRDTGSDGLDAAKGLKTLGYISGYTHAFGLQAVLQALQVGPVIIGIEWTDGFDNPDINGLVTLSSTVRGGHEVCLDEIDVVNHLVWFRNSWGQTWGLNGRAAMSWTDLETLLKNQGDATVFVPLSEPAPVPVPPIPTPTPTPTPPVPTTASDLVLAAHARDWFSHRHFGPSNDALRTALKDWLASKGL